MKALIEDLRLNHEFCPKEVILQAADELERLSQRAWVGLTDADFREIYETYPIVEEDPWDYERAIEAKLKEKNT
jgi:hypothetical protein